MFIIVTKDPNFVLRSVTCKHSFCCTSEKPKNVSEKNVRFNRLNNAIPFSLFWYQFVVSPLYQRRWTDKHELMASSFCTPSESKFLEMSL